MIVLGIESSCDETGVAVVKNGREVLANVVASSLKFHSKYGGVVPEIASRMQLESIAGVYAQALKDSRILPEQIDLVSLTVKPGLPGSLLVGISFAKALALSLDKPLLGINHIYSHIYANFLCHREIKLPSIGLVVSGGHTSLFYIKDFSNIREIGSTRDDACGEAFDKVAKILGAGYPGGPLIEKLARRGNKDKIRLACCGTVNELDFSFSGIKTAVLYYLKGRKANLSLKQDLAACFQESAVDALIRKSLFACRKNKVKQLLIGGGVAANNRFRSKLEASAKRAGIRCFFPGMELCMDNAAMVAGLAYQLYKNGARDDLYLNMQYN